MLARLFVKFEPGIYIPKEVPFPTRIYERDGYTIRELIPARNAKDEPALLDPEVTIDGKPTLLCNYLRIEFFKEKFESSPEDPPDPPNDLIRFAITSQVTRFRFLLKAGGLRPPNFPLSTWTLQYLNDDGTELPSVDGFSRTRAGGAFEAAWIALTPEHWKEIIALPPDFYPELWDDLLLDSSFQLPHIGPAIVLAATALEVLISNVLDKLAAHKGTPPSLWEWMNTRKNWSSNPSVEEQYDSLLKEMSGHSLKEDAELWQVFQHLKMARNKFVHEGAAKLDGKPLTQQEASALVQKAWKIPRKIREWLPESLRWKLNDIRFNLSVSKRLI